MLREIRAMFLAIALFAPSAIAAQDAPDRAIDAQARDEVIETLSAELRENYVFPEVAGRVATELRARADAGAYDSATTARALASSLHEDLREIGKDGHFSVRYRPGFEPYEPDETGAPDAGEIAEMRRESARHGYGIARIERLPGNVGYLDVRAFIQPEFAAPAYEAAMQLLDGSDAIIVDMRSNGGGDPQSVAQLMSHFLPFGTDLLINSIYDRPEDSTREFWNDKTVETRFTGPVYVLTSDVTFSGGEEFAYDMQTHGRGTLIGETTGGGANPGAMVQIGHGMIAFIPTGRAINPITGTNWEGTGVAPDHPVAADKALQTGLAMALERIAGATGDADRREKLAGLRAKVRNGEVALPQWKHPRRD